MIQINLSTMLVAVIAILVLMMCYLYRKLMIHTERLKLLHQTMAGVIDIVILLNESQKDLGKIVKASIVEDKEKLDDVFKELDSLHTCLDLILNPLNSNKESDPENTDDSNV